MSTLTTKLKTLVSQAQGDDDEIQGDVDMQCEEAERSMHIIIETTYERVMAPGKMAALLNDVTDCLRSAGQPVE